MSNEINIPSTICFRVTRKCNIKCSFCQAPPTGEFDMSLDEIKRCIDTFALAGMKSIKFTGENRLLGRIYVKLFCIVKNVESYLWFAQMEYY